MEVLQDWTATGRINAQAIGPPSAVRYALMVEDRRVIEDLAGLPLHDVRWRFAGLEEVKAVLRTYHDEMAREGIAGFGQRAIAGDDTSVAVAAE